MTRLALPLIEAASLFPNHVGMVLIVWSLFAVVILTLKELET